MIPNAKRIFKSIRCSRIACHPHGKTKRNLRQIKTRSIDLANPKPPLDVVLINQTFVSPPFAELKMPVSGRKFTTHLLSPSSAALSARISHRVWFFIMFIFFVCIFVAVSVCVCARWARRLSSRWTWRWTLINSFTNKKEPQNETERETR